MTTSYFTKALFQLDLSFSPAVKGTLSIPMEVSSALAPSAVLLVYTLHPEGEVIADTIRFHVEKCFKNEVRGKEGEKDSFSDLFNLLKN